MVRRVYVAFPYAGQARRVVAELEAAGVARNQIHAIAKPGLDCLPLTGHNAAMRFGSGNECSGTETWGYSWGPGQQRGWLCSPVPSAGQLWLPPQLRQCHAGA